MGVPVNLLVPPRIVPTPFLGRAGNALVAAFPAAQPFTGILRLRIWDVEHGACAMLHHEENGIAGRLAMIDSGSSFSWSPSRFIRYSLDRTVLDYLFITNADQDHISDLQGLWDYGVSVPVWHRNPTLSPQAFQQIKERGGPLTDDAWRYLRNLSGMVAPVSQPFNNHMGGVTCELFWNSYPKFTNANDLSLVVFIKFAGFKILFPGDLEKAGWLALLENPRFRTELADTDILVASHHGRENGYCEELFDYCRPQAVVMSDRSIVHDTQLMVQTYHNKIASYRPQGVLVATTGRRRHVLTTRRDGHVQFDVGHNRVFSIATQKMG